MPTEIASVSCVFQCLKCGGEFIAIEGDGWDYADDQQYTVNCCPYCGTSRDNIEFVRNA
jgi:DNA-directed RNA polymerase subunit RPC12/RpoP